MDGLERTVQMIGAASTLRSRVGLRAWLGGLAALALMMQTAGCSNESIRVALDTQQRANDVQQTIFDNQHEGLCIYLYRDLVRRLEDAGEPLSAPQRVAINDVWNDRDLIEFWAVQHERAKALRLVGVDAKLYADQSPVDLLLKAVEARMDRVQQSLAAHAGAAVAEDVETGVSEDAEE